MEKYAMTDIRDYLKELKTPIVIYGTGDGADRLIDDLNSVGVKISGVFASDGFVRKRTFRGFEVTDFDSMLERFPDMTVLMCFGSDRAEVRLNIDKISSRVPLFFPEYPVYGDSIFNSAFYEKHRAELDFIRSHLADALSVKTFDNIIKFRLSGKTDYLFECESDDEPSFEVDKKTVFLDFGAYNGDTAVRFAEEYPSYGEIIAVEPDKRNFRKLVENTAKLRDIRCINAAVGDRCGELSVDSKKGRGAHADENGKLLVQCITVDSLTGGENRKSVIKADVEGNEAAFIRGASRTIREKRPQMRIACYHRSEDLFSIPSAVLGLRSDYRVFLRHKSGVPSWNMDFLFV